MGQQQNAIKQRPLSPWVAIAREDGLEWGRHSGGAPLAEFTEWIYRVYEPATLRAGLGWAPGRPLSAKDQEILDDVHCGLAEAARLMEKRWAVSAVA